MKTPEEILNKHIINRFDEIDRETFINAMKEYAKQWVALAATEAGDDTRSVTKNANVIWEMKQEIDAQ